MEKERLEYLLNVPVSTHAVDSMGNLFFKPGESPRFYTEVVRKVCKDYFRVGKIHEELSTHLFEACGAEYISKEAEVHAKKLRDQTNSQILDEAVGEIEEHKDAFQELNKTLGGLIFVLNHTRMFKILLGTLGLAATGKKREQFKKASILLSVGPLFLRLLIEHYNASAIGVWMLRDLHNELEKGGDIKYAWNGSGEKTTLRQLTFSAMLAYPAVLVINDIQKLSEELSAIQNSLSQKGDDTHDAFSAEALRSYNELLNEKILKNLNTIRDAEREVVSLVKSCESRSQLDENLKDFPFTNLPQFSEGELKRIMKKYEDYPIYPQVEDGEEIEGEDQLEMTR